MIGIRPSRWFAPPDDRSFLVSNALAFTDPLSRSELPVRSPDTQHLRGAHLDPHARRNLQHPPAQGCCRQ